MFITIKSREEIFSLIEKIFGEPENLQVETRPEEIIIRKAGNVVEKTKGTIKNLDLNTIKIVAESEEFCGD